MSGLCQLNVEIVCLNTVHKAKDS